MFIGLEELRERTSFDGVSSLSDQKLYSYMDRADAWIRRAVHNPNIEDVNDINVQTDLETATVLLIEYLWFWDDPDTKISALSQEESVKIGSYSYNRTDPGGKTGLYELDSILERYVYRPTIGSLFRVSGPSRK